MKIGITLKKGITNRYYRAEEKLWALALARFKLEFCTILEI